LGLARKRKWQINRSRPLWPWSFEGSVGGFRSHTGTIVSVEHSPRRPKGDVTLGLRVPPLPAFLRENRTVATVPSSVRQSVSLPARIAKRVLALAENKKTSASHVLVDLIETGLQAKEAAPAFLRNHRPAIRNHRSSRTETPPGGTSPHDFRRVVVAAADRVGAFHPPQLVRSSPQSQARRFSKDSSDRWICFRNASLTSV
jgi:hypothetical protein